MKLGLLCLEMAADVGSVEVRRVAVAALMVMEPGLEWHRIAAAVAVIEGRRWWLLL